MSQGYFDIDAILSDQVAIPVDIKHDLIKLGHFDPNGEGNDLKEGTKLEFPMWLARAVKNHAQASTPLVYTPPYRETLKADATVLRLFEWNEFYFEFGMEYVKLLKDIDLGKVLLDAFGARYTSVMDMSQNAVDEDTSLYTSGLDALERRLFEAGHRADKEYTKWLRRGLDKIKMAVSVEAASRKRKRGSNPT